MIKKFATALFIYAGPLAYEFLQNNLPEHFGKVVEPCTHKHI